MLCLLLQDTGPSFGDPCKLCKLNGDHLLPIHSRGSEKMAVASGKWQVASPKRQCSTPCAFVSTLEPVQDSIQDRSSFLGMESYNTTFQGARLYYAIKVSWPAVSYTCVEAKELVCLTQSQLAVPIRE